MAFPNEIVTFPTKTSLSPTDGALVKQFQQAIHNQDWDSALTILRQIPNYTNKIINASYLNSLATTVNALETYYLQRFSPSYIVSDTQPATQDIGDFWFQITD